MRWLKYAYDSNHVFCIHPNDFIDYKIEINISHSNATTDLLNREMKSNEIGVVWTRKWSNDVADISSSTISDTRLKTIRSQLAKELNALFEYYIFCINLNKCNLSLTDKIAFCKQSSRYYNMEFFGDTSLGDRQWGMKYRSKRYDLKQTLDKKSVEKKIITLFTEFESNAENFTNRLQQNTYEDNYKLLSSIIHMHVNRMFRTKQRLNECAIHNLLYRYYKSKKNMIHQN